MEKWLSGRKRFFAKEVNLKRVPRVRIPPSPPFIQAGRYFQINDTLPFQHKPNLDSSLKKRILAFIGQDAFLPNLGYAQMAELADALDSKSCIFGCAGSTPALGTIFSLKICGAFLWPRFVLSYGAFAKPKKGCPFIK